jgi:hypothetical protein
MIYYYFFTIEINEELFKKITKMNYLNILKIMLYINPNINLSFDNEIIFITACENEYINIAKWLLHIKPNINISVNDNYIFKYACKNNKIKLMHFLYPLNKWSFHERGHYDFIERNDNCCYIELTPFTYCCYINNLFMAKNILNIDKYSINNILYNTYDATYIFAIVCQNGYLNIARYILHINPNINISEYDDFIFRTACEFGQLNIAKWLLHIKSDINFSTNNFTPFRFACYNNHFHICKWIIQTDDTNKNWYFKWCCDNKHIELAKILESMYPDRLFITYYNCQDNDNIIINYKIFKPLIVKNTVIQKNIKKCFLHKKCIICLENYPNIFTICNHNFCINCITKIYNYNDKITCPYCRYNLNNNDLYYII